MKHKYIDYFFAFFELSILIGCIFNLGGESPNYYRFMLGLSSVELCLRRLDDAIKEGQNE